MEEFFLSLNMLHYHTVKKKECFIALGTLGFLKMGRVPQKAAEGQQDLIFALTSSPKRQV